VVTLLETLDVAPRSVVLAHAGDIADRGYLSAVARTGAYIGCDRFGMEALFPDEQRLENVTTLITNGHLEQLLLSHDCASFIDHFTDEHRTMMSPQWSYTHLHSRVLPRLADMGIDEAQIKTLLEENPKRLLAGVEPRENGAPVAGKVSAGVE
jgi:phosphotriesterase-related protein